MAEVLSPNITLLLITTGSYTVVASSPLNGLNKFVRDTFTQVNQVGDREYTTEELFKFEDVPPGDYLFGMTYDFGIVNDLILTAAPDGDTKSYIEVSKQNQAGDFRVLRVPNNMPYGTDGITLGDFIKGIQKKYNLVIYPSKTKQREFVVETYNEWIKNYTLKDWNKYVDLSQKMEVIPANNLGYKEVQFGDTLDVDYVAEEFKKLNNREFGKTYYRDNQNFYSQGQLKMESSFSTSPLVYMQGTGLSGSLNLQSGTLIQVGLTDTFDPYNACTLVYTNVYIQASRNNFEINDVLYTDQFLTQPLTGYTYVRNNGTSDTDYNIYALDDVTGQVGSLVANCNDPGGGGPTS